MLSQRDLYTYHTNLHKFRLDVIDFLNDIDPVVLSSDLRKRYRTLLISLNGLFATDDGSDGDADDGMFDDNGDNEVTDEGVSQSDDNISCGDNSVVFREHHLTGKPSATASGDDGDIYEGII